ncbi:MAG: response regulator, partial [Candidatus Eisenbacteria bacterium]|nr:response regulator [Candidatus Eisenbacteria bacterium]
SLDSESSPAAVLSDINLPDLNGLEFMRRLQAHPEWCVVPAVLMTSDPTRDQLLLARKLRVPPEGFLVKPVTLSALEEILQGIISRTSPIYVLRHLQRQRLSHELRARSKDRDLGSQIQEVVKSLEEAAKERDMLEKEVETARVALDGLGSAEQKANLNMTMEELMKDEHRLRARLRELQDHRADLQAQRKKLVGEIDRALKLLDAQIRTAEDVVRHRIA